MQPHGLRAGTIPPNGYARYPSHQLERHTLPHGRIGRLAGYRVEGNIAGHNLNQVGEAENVKFSNTTNNFYTLETLSTEVFQQIPVRQKPFWPAKDHVGILSAQLAEMRKLLASNPADQKNDDGQLQDLEVETESTLENLQQLVEDWKRWDNDTQRRWLEDEGKDRLESIVESLKEVSVKVKDSQLMIQPLERQIRNYMLGRTEQSATSDDRIDFLIEDPEQWEAAKKDMVTWGMSETALDTNKMKIVHFMQKFRSEGVEDERGEAQAAEYAEINMEMEAEVLINEDPAELQIPETEEKDIAITNTRWTKLRIKSFWEGGRTIIHLTRDGDRRAVQMLLECGVSPNGKDEQHWTALHWAARYGFIEILVSLISHGALLDAYNNEHWTPLYLAAVYNHKKVVTALLEAGADIWVTGVADNIPLHEAAYAGSFEIVKMFLDAGSEIDKRSKYLMTPLMLSAYSGSPEVTSLLLQRGAEINLVDDTGMSPLASAASKGFLSIVEVLVREGARINQEDSFGWTPLHFAIYRSRVDVVQYLIRQRADLNVTAEEGRSLLHFACNAGSLEVLEMLLKARLRVNVKDKYGVSPLHMAARAGRLHIVRELLDPTCGAVLTARTSDGWTPLHEACHSGHVAVIGALLERGAPVNARDKWQWTPMHRAAQRGQHEIVHLLLDYNSDIDAKNSADWTPLHEAAYYGSLETVQVLLEYDADISAMDQNGYTALSKAQIIDRPDIVEMIQRQEDRLQSRSRNYTAEELVKTYNATAVTGRQMDTVTKTSSTTISRLSSLPLVHQIKENVPLLSFGLCGLTLGFAVRQIILSRYQR